MADTPPAEKPTPTPITPISPIGSSPARQLERFRYLPDWETPVNPPKKPLLSRAKVSRTWRRSRLATALRSQTSHASSPRPPVTPVSNDSFHKEGSFAGGGLLPTAHSTYSIRPPPPSPYKATLSSRLRSRFGAIFPQNRKYPCGLTARVWVVIVALALIIVALALGLGLGLGLRNHRNVELPLPTSDPKQPIYEGDLTYFAPALGACGWASSETDLVCAVSHKVFDAAGANAHSGGNPNMNPLCGKTIRVMRDNAAVDVRVVDRCTECEPTDLDLSPGVFNSLATQAQGRVRGKWQWL